MRDLELFESLTGAVRPPAHISVRVLGILLARVGPSFEIEWNISKEVIVCLTSLVKGFGDREPVFAFFVLKRLPFFRMWKVNC